MDFIRALKSWGRRNHFVQCSDEMGLGRVIREALKGTVGELDFYEYDARLLRIDSLRQVKLDSSKFSVGGAPYNVVLLKGMTHLLPGLEGVLLKVVEESNTTLFIMQAAGVRDRLRTLRSRSHCWDLAYLNKRRVIGNLERLGFDTSQVESRCLWDGTLGGTLKRIGMQDQLGAIEALLRQGRSSIPKLFSSEITDSVAIPFVVGPKLIGDEERFLLRTLGSQKVRAQVRDRIKLLLFLLQQKEEGING